MRIRELALRVGTTTRTLRYYEAQGLLPAGRSANGYRVYDEQHVRLVGEIRSLQAIGFSLADVRPFVECLLAGHESGDECPASVNVYRRKLAYLERHITELQDARDRLSERLAELGGAPAPACELGDYARPSPLPVTSRPQSAKACGPSASPSAVAAPAQHVSKI